MGAIMGHIRLGRMPTTRKWRQVVALLGEFEPSIADIAEAVEGASDRSLADAVKDPGFVEALWLMLKIPAAARSASFEEELAKLGITVPPDDHRPSCRFRQRPREGQAQERTSDDGPQRNGKERCSGSSLRCVQ